MPAVGSLGNPLAPNAPVHIWKRGARITSVCMRMRGTPAARLMPSQSFERQPCRSYLDERLTGLHSALVVLRQSPIAIQSGKTSFNDPASRLDAEAARARRLLNGLEVPSAALLLAPSSQLLATVGGIDPDPLEPRREVRQPAEKLALDTGPFCVREVARICRAYASKRTPSCHQPPLQNTFF